MIANVANLELKQRIFSNSVRAERAVNCTTRRSKETWLSEDPPDKGAILRTAVMLTRREVIQTAVLASMMSLTCNLSPVAAQRVGFFATTLLAEAGLIYGLPIVTSYAFMYEQAVDRHSSHFKASFNQIKNEVRVFTSDDTSAVLPNNDKAYSFAWMDLRAEPIVLSVPAVDATRYYSIMLRDGRFYSYGYIGSRATGSQAGAYLVAGPDWHGEAPSVIRKVFRSSTQFSLALFRTQFIAAAAKLDFYGDDPREAVLALTQVDDDERRPDGGKHDYTLTFAQGRLPPVNAFWSLTMYDGRSQSLIASPIDRYLVNSSMLPAMKTNTNGELTIHAFRFRKE